MSENQIQVRSSIVDDLLSLKNEAAFSTIFPSLRITAGNSADAQSQGAAVGQFYIKGQEKDSQGKATNFLIPVGSRNKQRSNAWSVQAVLAAFRPMAMLLNQDDSINCISYDKKSEEFQRVVQASQGGNKKAMVGPDALLFIPASEYSADQGEGLDFVKQAFPKGILATFFYKSTFRQCAPIAAITSDDGTSFIPRPVRITVELIRGKFSWYVPQHTDLLPEGTFMEDANPIIQAAVNQFLSAKGYNAAGGEAIPANTQAPFEGIVR